MWFKPEKTGWLLRRRHLPNVQQWKKLHCMIKGNYLFYISKLVQSTNISLLKRCNISCFIHFNTTQI